MSLESDFTSRPESGLVKADVVWGDGQSLYQGWQTGYCTAGALWSGSDDSEVDLPSAGYDASVLKTAMSGVSLAPENTGVGPAVSGKSYRTVFNPFFPMAMLKCDPGFLNDVFDSIDTEVAKDIEKDVLTKVLPDMVRWMMVEQLASAGEKFITSSSGADLGW